ncbi:MAG: hypothetical protein AAF171_12435 [Cyanobacteria bacterium P01_A01_bin.116]
MKLIKVGQSIAASMAVLLLVPTDSSAAVFADSGANAVSITSTVEAFRAALGEPNNGNALGPVAAGRREINWDAGIVPVDMPGDFFNVTVPRGAEFSTEAGSAFKVSNPVDPDDPSFPDNEFNSINPTYPEQFITFSPERLFTPIGTNVLDVNFFVSGSDVAATTNGFGAVFTDVDLADSTTLEFYDVEGNLLGSSFVPAASEGLSFYGETFDEGNLFSVRIISGNTPIGPDDDPDNGVDVVVMDNFIYGEPQAVPEPSVVVGMMAIGAFAHQMKRRRDQATKNAVLG